MSNRPRFCLLLLLLPLFAKTVAAFTNKTAELVYGIPHYPPYSEVHKDRFSGRDVELVEILAEKAGVNIVFSPCEWVRCLELAKAGKVDILTSLAYTPERESFLHFIQPAYSVGSIVFLVRKGESQKLSDFSDLFNMTIGKEKGAKLFQRVDDHPDIEMYESPSFETLLKMLSSGRLDAVMGANIGTVAAFQNSKYTSQLELAQYSHQVPSGYIGLTKHSKNASAWLPEIQQQMQNMVDSGELLYFITWKSTSPQP